MRALRSAGAHSFLIYDNTSRALRRSTACQAVLRVPDVATSNPAGIAAVINDLHDRAPIDCVLGSDLDSLLLLAKVRDMIRAPVYPMASPDVLAALHDKWRFTTLCESLQIDVPDSMLISGPADFARCSEQIGFPLVIKPVDQYGQRGVVVCRDAYDLVVRLRDYPYAPCIAQERIPGDDWGASIFARAGEITHWATFLCPDYAAAVFRENEDLMQAVRKIVAYTGFTGVANFDARCDRRTGRMKLFECNPRFFLRLTAARLNGLDFVQAAAAAPEGTTRALTSGVYRPWRDLFTLDGVRALCNGAWPAGLLFEDLAELLADPWPIVLRKAAKGEKEARKERQPDAGIVRL